MNGGNSSTFRLPSCWADGKAIPGNIGVGAGIGCCVELEGNWLGRVCEDTLGVDFGPNGDETNGWFNEVVWLLDRCRSNFDSKSFGVLSDDGLLSGNFGNEGGGGTIVDVMGIVGTEGERCVEKEPNLWEGEFEAIGKMGRDSGFTIVCVSLTLKNGN